MSGIAGIYYLDGRPVERTDVQRMVDSIAHRGPDGCGVWTDGSVGLGHRMLWTTPESLHEKLPLSNKTGDLTITADARIDNRDELILVLNFNGRPRETITDSELILTAYEKWGDKCPEKLLGDFSFAIWDKRKQTVFCARDHMGVKPFYYYHSDNVFVFASEIKALLSLSEVPRYLNEVKVADYLMSTLEDKTNTFYKKIFRLPPAHLKTADNKRIPVQPYWSLDPLRELKLSSDEEYAEAFRNLFKKSVHCRLRSAFPIGSMLSGGLDSSSIVCMARHLLSQNGGGKLHTFSAVFDDVPECDERQFINTVLIQGGLEPHYIQADRISPLVDLDHVFYHQDEPFYAPNLFIDWRLCGAAQKHGIRVLLDGTDGDSC
jgi:asparagine synthase (glutamine-hydrolysing)